MYEGRLLDASPTFTDVVEAAADDYFGVLLPRCLDAWLAGRGYRLIAELLAAHDADALDALRQLPAPSARALALAQRARSQCPLVVVGNLYVDAHGHAVLGQYAHRSIISPHFLLSFQVVAEEHLVTLFEPAFAAAVAPERLVAEVRLTIFHEYIHYFESFLPAEEQPLRAREQGKPHRRYTPAEAGRRDRRYTWRRRALLVGGPLLAVALAVAITPQLMAPRDALVRADHEEPRARERDAGPPRDLPAERAALRARLLDGILTSSTPAALAARVGPPIGDTTDRVLPGIFVWADLVPIPGRPGLPDVAGLPLQCWPQPSAQVLARDLLCVAWRPDGAELFEARPARRDRR